MTDEGALEPNAYFIVIEEIVSRLEISDGETSHFKETLTILYLSCFIVFLMKAN